MSIISSMQVKVLSAAIVAVLWSTASPVRAYKALDYEYLHELHNGSSIKSYGDLSPTYSVAYTTRMYNATLHKCRCLGDQVWDGWRCLNTSTIVVVHNPITKHIIAVQTREFGNVETGLPQCAAGEVLALLDSNRGSVQQFSLLDSGYLYWQQRQYEKYCIDHTMDNNGEPLSWEALVCLPPPKVPLCCPQGPGLAPNYSCATHFGQVIIAPPVMVDGVLTDWPAGVNGDIINVTCKGLQELVNVSLNNLEIHLNYQSGNVSLVWSSTNLQGAKQQDFCVSVEEGREDYIVKTCYEDPVASHYTQCSNATCVRKCCPESQLIVGYSCDDAIYESEFWNPTFYDPDSVSQIVPSPSGLKIVYGFPLCENFFVIGDFESENTNISLLNDGYLYASGYKDAYPPDRYCLDKFRIEPSASTQALLCFDDNTEASTCSKVRSYLYPSLLLVSCMFLSLTLAAYASLAELRNKLHGKCLLSLVSSLLIAYILLASIFLTKVNISTGICRTIASVLLWSSLSAFFWLNVMCFDIWRTLKMMRTTPGSAEWIRRRYRNYSIYSWGCPLLLTLVAIIMESLPDKHQVIRPNFSSDTCWFTESVSMWVYLYGYVSILVMSNTVFFLLVAYVLISSHNDPMLKRSRENNRERMWLYLKLFLVMGITWLADVISYEHGSCAGWMPTDIINGLQGLTIFLVFVCKRSTLRKIREQCCGSYGVTGSEEVPMNTRQSNTSNTRSTTSNTCSTTSNTRSTTLSITSTSTTRTVQGQNSTNSLISYSPNIERSTRVERVSQSFTNNPLTTVVESNDSDAVQYKEPASTAMVVEINDSEAVQPIHPFSRTATVAESSDSDAVKCSHPVSPATSSGELETSSSDPTQHKYTVCLQLTESRALETRCSEPSAHYHPVTPPATDWQHKLDCKSLEKSTNKNTEDETSAMVPRQ